VHAENLVSPLKEANATTLRDISEETLFLKRLESTRGFAALHVLAGPVNLYVLKK